MTDTATTRTIIGLIGNVISFLLFLSPVPTFVKIIKEKAVKDFKSDPYVATLLNCAMWIFYGLPLITHNNTLVVTINGIGFVIEYPDHRRARHRSDLHGHRDPDYRFRLPYLENKGNVCWDIVYHLQHLYRMVIKTKSVKYMPFYLSLANFTNGLVWLIYGLLDFDINLVLPNGLGALSGLIQLILYGIYYRSTIWDDDNDVRGDRSEVELSSSA
ncbi:hypothetical protein DKX38_022701 [Salix brachista]|uniref:Bidirectional sugar transporter SWEET n=1 Tax=Salix brachista TaxID=2182728 RepID=A0A5N5K0U2_9ROSI|nr:hypothetical protein DKX38_022701 [Salix brachista]